MTRSAPPSFVIAAAKTFAVVNASEPASAGSLTSKPFAAPIASAVRMPDVSPFGAIETMFTSPAPAVATSCSAISTP